MPRAASWRRIKSRRCYTVLELAEQIEVAVGTVRSWLKRGLPALRAKRPTLIRGYDAINFLKRRVKDRKQPCQLWECYCFSCHLPQKPALGMVDLKMGNDATGMIEALCADCGTVMHKRISRSQAEALADVGGITLMKAQGHLEVSK